MERIDTFLKFLLSWEGGFCNVKGDRGGATNMGVTIATWKKVGYDKDGDGDIDVQDLRLLTKEDVRDRVLRPYYWNRWKADQIKDPYIAYILVDWVWGSGKWGIVYAQRILGVKDDGIVGPKTLAALNSCEPRELFAKLWERRERHFRSVASQPGQSKFLKGWLRRLGCIQYGKLILNH